jgi:hypothetical protein
MLAEMRELVEEYERIGAKHGARRMTPAQIGETSKSVIQSACGPMALSADGEVRLARWRCWHFISIQQTSFVTCSSN